MISTLQALKAYLWGWNFGSFCSTTTGFQDIGSPENQKCTEWPQTELKHLTVKITVYTLNTYPWGPNFDAFCSTISHFRDTTWARSAKIGKCTERSQTELEHLAVKSTINTLNTYPRDPNFGPFRSTISRFHVQGRQRSEMQRITPSWTWTLNSQKYIH